jgi:hypothetical protein
MPKITNQEVVNSLLAATEQGQIDWQPTAIPDQFTASFGGKWTLLFTREFVSGEGTTPFLYFKDSEGQTLLRITRFEDNRIPEVYELARRYALKIDEALADLLKEIEKRPK